MNNYKKIAAITFFTILVLGYNNCGQVKFSNAPTGNAAVSVPPGSIAPSNLKASIQDVPALVGWYVYTPNTNLATTTPTNPPAPTVNFTVQSGPSAGCPAIGTVDATDTTHPGDHGQLSEYCYEPSGAHGMFNGNSGGQYDILKEYIFSNTSTATVIPELSTIFSNPAYQISENRKFIDGLFYYALSYLWIPASQNVNDPNFDVNFSIENVDDGLELISNDGTIVGNDVLWQSASFSMNKGQDNGTHLNPGANVITAIWVDDNATGRHLDGDQMSYTTTGSNGYTALAALPPNVLRGYIYEASSVNSPSIVGISGATVTVACSSTGFSTTSTATGSDGFFSIQNFPDGTCTISTTVGGVVTDGGTRTFLHTVATSALQQLYQPL